MYPEAPRIIASFIRSKIRKKLLGELISSKGGVKRLIETLDEAPSKLNPFYFVEIEKGWGNRHMFRAPYSFNEKTWLVSLPISHINSFLPKDAEPGTVLDKQEQHSDFFGAEGDATDLMTDAMDWHAVRKKEEPKTEKKFVRWEQKISEEHFPPCIKLILQGLDDGKKRSIFTLVNFLKMMNWTPEEIEKRMFEWNANNRPPLPNSIILSTIRYHGRREAAPPANCFNNDYYVSFGVCRPDDICKFMNKNRTSNPIAYPFKKMKPAKRKFKKLRGFSCLCGKEFPSERSLALHKGKVH